MPAKERHGCGVEWAGQTAKRSCFAAGGRAGGMSLRMPFGAQLITSLVSDTGHGAAGIVSLMILILLKCNCSCEKASSFL